MTKLLVIADDFTGALDTGIQFAREGTKTCVVIGADGVLASRADYPVIVIDSETRHLPHIEAYETVCRLVNEARAAGVGYIYKKTDSAASGRPEPLAHAGRRMLAHPAVPGRIQTSRAVRLYASKHVHEPLH